MVARMRVRKQSHGEASARKQLEDNLQDLRLLLSQAYAGFNAAVDSELVESYIYEIQSLQARMNYLLRRIKEFELCAATAAGAPQPGRVPWT